jgi:enoyl-CoA hydratase/carnithine racemase
VLRQESLDGVLWLTLDRPERLNAFTASDYRALTAAIGAAADDDATRAVVLTGTGRAFSAGADRSLFEGPLDPDEGRQVQEDFRSMLIALAECAKPVIAAVNGLAVGLGATILLHCDLVILATSARLRLPFTELGLVPEAASSVLLPARVGWSEAAWLLLSGEWIDADRAQSIGLAWRVVPDDNLIAAVAEIGAALAALDPASIVATKRLLLHGRRALVDAALNRESAAMQALQAARRPPT